MIPRKIRCIKSLMVLAIPVLVLSVTKNECRADSISSPHSYEVIAGAHDEFRFVMLAYDPMLNDAGVAYPVSGLYKNDGSTSPIWQVDWYADYVRVTRDGRYLARLGPWASSLSDLAVAFYDRGEHLRSFKISDIIKDEKKLPQSVSHFNWRSDIAFDDNRGLLRIAIHDGQVLTFSMSTGQLLDGN